MYVSTIDRGEEEGGGETRKGREGLGGGAFSVDSDARVDKRSRALSWETLVVQTYVWDTVTMYTL